MRFDFTQPKKHPTTAGFGLVELLVAMTIMALVSAVVLVKDSSFKGTIVLRNQAYEVAFMVRQAQLLAVGATDAGGVTAGQRYGVRVDRTDNSIMLFSDSNPLGYNDGDLILDRRRLDNRFLFSEFTRADGTTIGGTPGTDALEIIFTRPNFDAAIYDDGGVEQSGTAHIVIGMPGSNATRIIEVLNSGSISVLSN